MAKKRPKASEVTWVPPVKCEVIVEKFGTYKKGDIISPVFRSTANALVKNKKVKILEDVPNPKDKK